MTGPYNINYVDLLSTIGSFSSTIRNEYLLLDKTSIIIITFFHGMMVSVAHGTVICCVLAGFGVSCHHFDKMSIYSHFCSVCVDISFGDECSWIVNE